MDTLFEVLTVFSLCVKGVNADGIYLSNGAIVGIAVGGILIIKLMVLVGVCCYAKCQTRKANAEDERASQQRRENLRARTDNGNVNRPAPISISVHVANTHTQAQHINSNTDFEPPAYDNVMSNESGHGMPPAPPSYTLLMEGVPTTHREGTAPHLYERTNTEENIEEADNAVSMTAPPTYVESTINPPAYSEIKNYWPETNNINSSECIDGYRIEVSEGVINDTIHDDSGQDSSSQSSISDEQDISPSSYVSRPSSASTASSVSSTSSSKY